MIIARKATIGFLREGAVLLVVFGFMDGVIGHKELADLKVNWVTWICWLVGAGFVLILLSVDLERRALKRRPKPE